MLLIHEFLNARVQKLFGAIAVGHDALNRSLPRNPARTLRGLASVARIACGVLTARITAAIAAAADAASALRSPPPTTFARESVGRRQLSARARPRLRAGGRVRNAGMRALTCSG